MNCGLWFQEVDNNANRPQKQVSGKNDSIQFLRLTFMALALYFVYKCKDYIHILALGFPKLLQYIKKYWAKPKDFILL